MEATRQGGLAPDENLLVLVDQFEEIFRFKEAAPSGTSAEAEQREVVGVIDVLRKSGRSFLTPPAEVPLKGSFTVDVSDESLVRVWRRLKTWVESEAESARRFMARARPA